MEGRTCPVGRDLAVADAAATAAAAEAAGVRAFSRSFLSETEEVVAAFRLGRSGPNLVGGWFCVPGRIGLGFAVGWCCGRRVWSLGWRRMLSPGSMVEDLDEGRWWDFWHREDGRCGTGRLLVVLLLGSRTGSRFREVS